MTRALVIGGSGFIGLHVIDALLARGIEVRATVRKSSPTMFLRKRKVELVRACLEDQEALEQAMRGCDVVLLTGAHYPRYSLELAQSLEQGVAGVRNACTAAQSAGVSRFIYTGTIATLAARHGRASHEDDLEAQQPIDSVYRATKWAMERELAAAEARGLRCVTLLPGGCVGEGDLRVGTSGVLVLLVRGELPFVVDGQVSLVDVRDVAKAHVAALDAPASRYNLAPHTLAFPALAELIVARYGGRVPELIDACEAARRADVAERLAAPKKARVLFPRELVDLIRTGHRVDCTRAERELGLSFSALEPALDRAHQFFERFGYLKNRNRSERQIA